MAHESIPLEQSTRVLRDIIDNLVSTLTIGQIYDDNEIVDYVLGKTGILTAIMERTKPVQFAAESDLCKWARDNGYVHESEIEKE